MKYPYTELKWIFAGLAVLFFLNGCGLWHSIFPPEQEKAPSELMSEGMERLEGGYYEKAAEAFQKIKDRYPYSRFAVEAELRMADALYKSGKYNEAYEAYNDFERLHPKNADIPYVIYQKGMCHFRQVSTIDRDQSHTYRAKEEFERLVNKFDDTEYAARAKNRIRECYLKMAEHELYVGHFYYKMEEYQAALNRYRYLLTHYPDLGHYHEALEYMKKCKEKLAEKQEG